MKYGYARVSTDDQNAGLQTSALKQAGCEQIYKDLGLSGATTKRPALLRCLEQLQPGDSLRTSFYERSEQPLRHRRQ